MSSLNGVLASNSRVQELRLAKLLFRNCTVQYMLPMIGRGVLEDGMMSSLNGALASKSGVQELRLTLLLFRKLHSAVYVTYDWERSSRGRYDEQPQWCAGLQQQSPGTEAGLATVQKLHSAVYCMLPMIGKGVVEDGMMNSLNGVLASRRTVQELRLTMLLLRNFTVQYKYITYDWEGSSRGRYDEQPQWCAGLQQQSPGTEAGQAAIQVYHAIQTI
jgi:hypothetical protein